MNILIAGGSGLIGRALITSLKNSHQISVIGRNKSKLRQQFTTPISCYDWDELNEINAQEIDTVINLCGYNIADRRWSNAIKQQLITSRINTTHALTQWAIRQRGMPHLICANAVGIYGIQDKQDNQSFDEESILHPDTPSDFLHEIGMRWQQALEPAIEYGMAVTSTRFGVVLKKNQGMLGKLQLSFYLGLGSLIGDGKQVLSWIVLDDLISALQFLITQPHLTGPFNLTSPYPVSQAEFAQTLAKTLHRPLLLRLPASVVRLLFGEMGECLLLSGQRVIPKRLLLAGFNFRYPKISEALAHEFS